ncbi:MAG: TRAP transporter permease, partial [Bacillota bacterium]
MSDSAPANDTAGLAAMWIRRGLAIGMSAFQLWTAATAGTMEAWQLRSIHLMFALLLIFTLPGSKRRKFNLSDIAFLIVGGVVTFYTVANYSEIVYRGGMPNTGDQIMALLLVLLVLEATRRTSGLPVAIVATVLLVYGLFGHLVPGPLGHPRFSLMKIADQIYNSSAGVFGFALAAAADFIFIFILFGSFLTYTKAGDLFTKFAFSITGRQIGGPAKAAVVASALVGTISGSGPGNVVTTGSFTIPLMKKVGYRPSFAAGVEAAASTGGILMPPVMGSAAFIMAAVTGIPYGKICVAAAIPAVLYFASVFWMTHLEAVKCGLKPLEAKDIPPVRESIRNVWVLLVPLLVLIYLLVSGQSALRAALAATFSLIVLSFFKKECRLSLTRFFQALEHAAIEMAPISIMCASAGIVVGMISLTGLGVKLGAIVMLLAGDSLLIALVLTAIAAMILGMGMPGVAAYVIIASTVAPALKDIGVPVLSAHLFAYYFSQMSAITPPVALSTYAAAALAGSDMWETGWVGFRLAAAGLIVPFMFVYGPALLWQGTPAQIALACLTSVTGTYCLAAALEGFVGRSRVPLAFRAVLFAASMLLI